MACYHHWKRRTGKTPFCTFNRSWNNALPTSPGLHGMGFCSMNGCPVAPRPVNFFVCEGTNDWRLLGTYDYLLWGKIAHHHISLLPSGVLDNWVNGMLDSKGGETWIEDINEGLEDARKIEHTRDSISDALKDGRLEIPFTILKCVGYPKDWFEKLLYYEQHPKPAKTKSKANAKSGKRRARGEGQGSPKKRTTAAGKGKGK
ncbi:hypothetical protein K438DRAFT_700373 [Mycena galopus ATCC 62051]|nr:hypothetical protein K438DRAFT_700373 [Mycena galopus ATCC 62051]